MLWLKPKPKTRALLERLDFRSASRKASRFDVDNQRNLGIFAVELGREA
jgi:hypothetical protein